MLYFLLHNMLCIEIEGFRGFWRNLGVPTVCGQSQQLFVHQVRDQITFHKPK